MHPLIRELVAAGPVLTDGAWGTELQNRGLPVGAAPETWNLSHPEQVLDVAEAYVEAGSQVILTNTFGGNRFRLEPPELVDRLSEINERGVEISHEAAAGRAFVFASMGPSGKLLATGDVTGNELQAAFEQQAIALAEAGADALVIETMGDLNEALLALAAARVTGLPTAVCIVFDSGKNRDRTLTGVTPEEAAAILTDAGADVVGANCGCGMAESVSICARLRAATDRPIWIKPNAGLPEILNGRAVYRISPQEAASYGLELVRAGASFIGGCCGTGPEFIDRLRRSLVESQLYQANIGPV